MAVLNYALPPHRHAKPKVMINMILSIFLGSMLGVGCALVAELMDRRVRSPFDISELLAIPVLAVVSASSDKVNPKKWLFNSAIPVGTSIIKVEHKC
jgi:capsular polysaccharide biosynthesis protein